MTVEEVLGQFEITENKRFDENQVSNELSKLIPQNSDSIDFELRAEILAFEFNENSNLEEPSIWGTYFGPKMVWSNADGTTSESPSIKYVTCDIVDYWSMRSKSSKNPILKARYLGLILDFEEKICGKKPDYKISIDYVESLIEIAKSDIYTHEVLTLKKLQRALSIAIKINNSKLIQDCKNEIIEYQNKVTEDNKPGLWRYKYDLLIDNKKVNLSNDEINEIISELESILTRLSTEDNNQTEIDPWAAEAAAKRLASYYRKKGDNQNVIRVLTKVGEAYEKIIKDGSPLQVNGWLEHLHRLYVEFNLKEQADALLIRIRELGPGTLADMKEFSHSFNIPKSKINEYVQEITSGTSEDILKRITFTYIPDREVAKNQLQDLAKKAPLQYLLTHKLQDDTGRTVATIGPLSEDLEGHIIRKISENLSFTSILLREVIGTSINDKKLSTDIIIDFLKKSPVFSENRFSIIRVGLDAFFENNFLVFIHIVIPQIEEATRKIIELSGGNTFKQARNGEYYHLKTFDEILRDTMVIETLGENLSNYFRLLFTDPRGWNLRNDVCHGLSNPDSFNSLTGDRILHALLCLGLVQSNE